MRLVKRFVESLSLMPTPPYRVTPYFTKWLIPSEPSPAIYEPVWRSWRRLVEVDGDLHPVRVVFKTEGQSPQIQLFLERSVGHDLRRRIQERVEWLLSLDVDYLEFMNVAQGTPIYQLAWRQVGLRPPRLPDLFESLVFVVSSRSESLLKSLGSIIKSLGPRRVVNKLVYYGFPSPEAVLEAGVEGLTSLGVSRSRAELVVRIAKAAAEGGLPSNETAVEEPRRAVKILQEVEGVGRSTAELAVSHVSKKPWGGFSDEYAVSRAIRAATGSEPDPSQVKEVSRKLGSYSGLAYFIASMGAS